MGVSIKVSGDTRNTEKFLRKLQQSILYKTLDRYGREGVAALSSATPKESGETAASWGYEVRISGGMAGIYWTNDHMAGDTPVAILLQYGHGTGTGGYVTGRDFINPAIQPVMDRIANDIWREITSS